MLRSRNKKYGPENVIVDFLFLLVWCMNFHLLKGIIFYGFDPPAHQSIYVALIQGFTSVLICLPAYSIGIKIFRSSRIFFFISWLTVIIAFALIPFQFDSFSFSIGYTPILNSGIPTFKGALYMLFAPQLIMAILASLILIKGQRSYISA